MMSGGNECGPSPLKEINLKPSAQVQSFSLVGKLKPVEPPSPLDPFYRIEEMTSEELNRDFVQKSTTASFKN